jgi:nucleoside-diphosphate-sugar epimerase
VRPDAPVLVTGASGFIGAHLTRHLAERGCRVRALDIHAPPSTDARIDFRVQDLRDAQRLAQALEGIEVVFHLASVHLDVNVPYSEFEAVNVAAVENLVGLCGAARVRRLVHVSSVGVYGHVAAPPAHEGALLAPQNDYERTKLAGERVARTSAARCGLDLVILRPAWVYGVGCPRTEKLLAAVRRGRFFYIGRGANLRHPVYIEDFLTALLLAADGGPELAGKTFNIAGPEWMPLERMVATAAEVMQVPAPHLHVPRWFGLAAGWTAELAGALLRVNPPISRRTLAFFDNDNAFDIDAARRELGFEPRVRLREGLQHVARTGSARPLDVKALWPNGRSST